MPRPNRPRTLGAEKQFRLNALQHLRDQRRSIPWLAQQMNDIGCSISTASLRKALRHNRTIFVDEAVAIAAVLQVPLDRFVDVVGEGPSFQRFREMVAELAAEMHGQPPRGKVVGPG